MVTLYQWAGVLNIYKFVITMDQKEELASHDSPRSWKRLNDPCFLSLNANSESHVSVERRPMLMTYHNICKYDESHPVAASRRRRDLCGCGSLVAAAAILKAVKTAAADVMETIRSWQ